MEMDVNEFLNLRDKLIMNDILISLLRNKVFLKSHYTPVAYAVMKVLPQTRTFIEKERPSKAKLPTRAQYAILVADNALYFTIAVQYKNHPPIVQHTPKFEGSFVQKCKQAAMFIFKHYNINAAKTCKVISQAPKDFLNYISNAGYSPNYWRMGYKKKNEQIGVSLKFNKGLVNEYSLLLKRIYDDYALFAKVLIDLYKNGTSITYEKQGVGILTFSISAFSECICITYNCFVDDLNRTELVNVNDFTPTSWKEHNFEIDIYLIRTLVN